ncbi:MAG: CHAD domain-containing protein [Myxococcota bacterium]
MIDPERPLHEELHRIMVEQVDVALIGLQEHGPTESVVHEARKASKRGRAVGQLVRPVLDRKVWAWLDHGFRDAARLLGPLRDADVARKNLGDAAPPRPESTGVTQAAIEAYQRARQRADAVPLHGFDDAELVAGLRASWRSARRAAAEASPGDPESFHEWRKAVKHLYYQVQLVRTLQPMALGGLADQLDVLQESLGDHHDTVIGAELAGPHAEGIDALIARRRVLEAQTVPLGKWLFASRPRRFARWIGASLAALRPTAALVG